MIDPMEKLVTVEEYAAALKEAEERIMELEAMNRKLETDLSWVQDDLYYLENRG